MEPTGQGRADRTAARWGRVLDSLAELTARTRAVARSLEATAGQQQHQNPGSVGRDYARLATHTG
jgi:hypothetical protein